MKVLAEIIELSTSADAPLSVILRKLLVLSYELKNGRLTAWANAELDGYESGIRLPDYRIISTGARGSFSGPFGAAIRNRALPASIIDKDLRHWATEARVGQNVASIESMVEQGGGRRPWPADLMLLYQHSFIQGYALADAWQDMPKQVFVGILDTIRNRALRFALELRSELGQVGNDLASISPAQVDRNVTNYIYGGNVVIGNAQGFNQVGSITVEAGDLTGLSKALTGLGVDGPDLNGLLSAIAEDKAGQVELSVGPRVRGWVEKICSGAGSAVLSVGADVAKVELTKAIVSYLGLS